MLECGVEPLPRQQCSGEKGVFVSSLGGTTGMPHFIDEACLLILFIVPNGCCKTTDAGGPNGVQGGGRILSTQAFSFFAHLFFFTYIVSKILMAHDCDIFSVLCVCVCVAPLSKFSQPPYGIPILHVCSPPPPKYIYTSFPTPRSGFPLAPSLVPSNLIYLFADGPDCLRFHSRGQ